MPLSNASVFLLFSTKDFDNQVVYSIPGANNYPLAQGEELPFSIIKVVTTPVCSGDASTITIESIAANLPDGPYTVTYDLSAPNASTGNTAPMTVADGKGSFTSINLTALGNTTITITNLASGTYSNPINANNTAIINVSTAPSVDIGNPIPAICIGGTTSPLDGSVVGNAYPTWSCPEGGTFSDVHDPNATWTPPATFTGTATLTLTATNGCAIDFKSKTVEVKVMPIVQIASATDPICQGGSSSLAGSFGGSATGILWTSSAGGSFSPSSTNINATWAPPAEFSGAATLTLTSTGSPCNISDSKNIVVNPASDGGTASAATSTVCSGNGTTITLTGQTGNIQWQQSANGTSGWANVSGGSGATQSTYSTPNLTATTYYRAQVTSGVCAPVYSNMVTVTVNVPSVGGTASSNQTICSGDSPSNISLSGYTGTIQWQKSTDNSVFTNITGATAATLTSAHMGTLSTTTYYRAQVTNGVCPSVNSSVVTVAVNAISVGGTAGATQSICSGSTPSNITLSGYNGSIQWQKSTDNSVFTNITGATSATLTSAQMGTLTATTYYRAQVTSGVCPPANSSVATVTVNSLPTAVISGTTSICAGNSANLSVVLTGTQPWSVTYTDGTTPVTVNNIALSPHVISVSPAATKTYTLTAVSDANCTGTSHTGSAVITINPVPTVNSPGNKTFCNGVVTTPITLTGSPAGVVFDITGGAAIGLANQTGVTSIPAFTPVAGLATITITPRANGCSGTPVDFFITVNATPTLSGASQSAPVCAGSAAVINLTGLRPTTTSTIAYSVNGVAQTPVTNIISNGAGNASFTTTALTAANNGQTLQITGVTTTSTSPNCSQAFSQNVTLTVNAAPVFTTCPSPLTLDASAGACSAVGTYSVVASGQPAPAYTYTFTGATTGSGTGTGSGSAFNAGTTNVRVTATNGCGSVNCNFTVVVTDNTEPVISNCPSNITVYTGAGRTSCDQAATWTEPTATDNCAPAGSLVWTKSHTPGTVFPVGTTTVTYTVKDANNKQSSCSFTVTVIDDTPPVFTPPSALTIYSDANCNTSRLPAITGNVTVKSDNCTAAADLVVVFTDGPNVAGACPGSYSFTRTWTVTDLNGISAIGTQVITVSDNIKPTLTVPPAKAISCTESRLPANTGMATATDNCSGAVTITYTDVTTAGSCLGNSTITRTWRATDCSGNSTTASQTITITDNLSPVVTINDLVAATPDVIPASYATIAAFQADGGTATDNCSNVSIVLWDEIANGLEGKPGYCPTSLVRTYRFTDACGNFIDKVQTITIQGDGGCNKCTSGTTFEWVDLMGQPSGTLVFSDLQRSGKCCNAGKSDDCISFNVRIDDNAVGVEILIDGATPSSQDWRIDCNPISMSNGMVCMPGGNYHLFTFCKPGGNKNTYTFRSIPGVVTGEGISTRVDCSGQITTTGIISGVTWNSISPGAPGQYNSYLSSTTVANPIFTAGPGAPSVIKYEVCGNIGTTICNALGRDCAEVTVNVKQKIALSLNVNPTLTCVNNPLVLVADINPSSNYSYEWHSGQGANSGTVLSTNKTLTLSPPVALGWYSLKVTDMDANGVSCSTSTFDFQVQADITGPSILTPPSGDLTVNCNDPNANTQIQNWLASATSTDESGNPLTVSHNYTGITMACGTVLPVVFSATDNCGNLNTATANVRVIDNQAPTWVTGIGALNRSVSCSDAAGYAAAQALEPAATDLCDPTLTLTKTTGAYVAGSCPHSGTYTNTWVARDDCNNTSAVYTQTITITDTTGPVFTTQAQNLTVECDGSGNLTELNNWIANHGGAAATDACGGAVTWSHSNPIFSDLCGSTGSATVTFTATDECGNPATSQATFTIADTQGPVVICPAPASGTTDNNECYSSSVVLGTPTASDNCSAPVTFTNNAPAHFPVGVTTVTWTATDACGNQSTCNQTVTVTDNNQPPTIACHGDVEDFITTNNCSKIGVVITPPDVTDNCPDPVLSWEMTGATTATGIGPITTSAVFNVGKTIVTYTVTDAGGHTASCSFQVWIKNLVAPKFMATCSANDAITAVAPLGQCQVSVSVETPSIDNPCDEAYTITNNSPYKTSDLDASGNYPVGVTSFTWTITDASGNITTCNQTVTVTDNQFPEITCQANVEDVINDELCYKTNVVLAAPVITDNCPNPVLTYVLTGATTGSGTGSASGLTFNVGKTRVHYTVTDAGMNTDTCSYVVWIKNYTKPQFNVTCPAVNTISQPADAGACTAAITVPSPTISNPCNEAFTMVNSFNNTNDASGAYPVGVTTVTWTITDASGNVTHCTQTITVTDTQAPEITCQSNVSEEIADDSCSKTVIFLSDPVVTDNCNNFTLSYVLTGATTGSGTGSASGLTYNIGKTRVHYTVRDGGNNTDTCSFQVWVKNLIEPPFTVTCPATTTITVDADPGLCTAVLTIPKPTISNPCNEAFTMVNSFNNTDDASGIYPIGITTVTWTITDASGIVTHCTQTVTVNDLPLTCPANITVPADFGLTHASNITVPAPGFSSNCTALTLTWRMVKPDGTSTDSPVTGINLVSSPATFDLGTTTITYTLTHATGITESCSFTVTVTSKPSITCLADITDEADLGDCNYTVNPGAPVLEDGAQPITWQWVIDGPTTPNEATGTFVGSVGNPGPPSIGAYDFKVGVSKVTWTATNLSGEDVCVQTVTITDMQKPEFAMPIPLSECVESLNSATYNPIDSDILPERPEYYVFVKGDKTLDLDPALFTDNCSLSGCTPEIRWQITMADGSKIPAASPYFIGQPSTYTSNILFLGDGITFQNVIHTITYWIMDCNGQVSDPKIQNITIKPRPNIIKVTN